MLPKLYENDQRVRAIIQAIIDGDNIYVLDNKYIRWGAVQRDIEAIIREKDAEIERLNKELLERDSIWLPDRDAEIERIRAILGDIHTALVFISRTTRIYDVNLTAETAIRKIDEALKGGE